MDKVKVFRISFQAIFSYSVVMKDGLMEENQFGCIVAGVHISSLKRWGLYMWNLKSKYNE